MDDSNVAVLTLLDSQTSPYKQTLTMAHYNNEHIDRNRPMPQEETDVNESQKQNIIWSKEATLTLLNLYETKMHMMDNPKKKTKMWTSMADELKSLGVEVTPDQVRWKINALTKKYKDCLEKCQGQITFKYFNEMHQILGQNNDDSGTYRLASGVVHGQTENEEQNGQRNRNSPQKITSPLRRLRSERKTKMELNKHWIEYLKRQDDQKQMRNERYERHIRLRAEELQLRKKELEMKQNIALRKLQLKEKKQEELLRIEKEKCLLLKQILMD